MIPRSVLTFYGEQIKELTSSKDWRPRNAINLPERPVMFTIGTKTTQQRGNHSYWQLCTCLEDQTEP
jgi:hypothetical protein